MMGFADVPLEIRRARKPRTLHTPASQNGEGSQMSNGVGTSHRLGSNVQKLSNQRVPSPTIPDAALAVSKTPSKNSTSSIDLESEDFYACSTASREGEALRGSPIMSELPSADAESIKRDNHTIMSPLLQTSGGVVVGTSKAVGKIIIAGFKSPFEVSLSAARGFHNVPRLYGDDTVRANERITGVWSGLRAAGKVNTLEYSQEISNATLGLCLRHV
jgi:hypothetical protein